jgi:hypothetical protein
MNYNAIVSIPWKTGVTPVDFVRVKVVAGGIEPAGATDRFVGTSTDGDLNTEQGSIQSKNVGLHLVKVGNTTALAQGDEVEGGANGTVVKLAAGTAIGVVVTAYADGSPAVNDVVRVMYY